MATSTPRAIWPAGPFSAGAGSASVTGAPARALATAPSGSNETTTIGTAPPDQAASAMRRTLGSPSASATAPSGEADRMTAATVTARCYAFGGLRWPLERPASVPTNEGLAGPRPSAAVRTPGRHRWSGGPSSLRTPGVHGGRQAATLRPMRTNLTADDVADLLEEPLVAILATRRPDDTMLSRPVWFEWRDGGFNVWASPNDKGKVRHIERDPRVSIVVANSDWPYKGIEVRGRGHAQPGRLLRRPRPDCSALLRRRLGRDSPGRSRNLASSSASSPVSSARGTTRTRSEAAAHRW